MYSGERHEVRHVSAAGRAGGRKAMGSLDRLLDAAGAEDEAVEERDVTVALRDNQHRPKAASPPTVASARYANPPQHTCSVRWFRVRILRACDQMQV